MKQCLLSRRTTRQVVWIPTEFAQRGKYLRIGDIDGWKVEEAYSAGAHQLTSAGRGFHHMFGSIS